MVFAIICEGMCSYWKAAFTSKWLLHKSIHTEIIIFRSLRFCSFNSVDTASVSFLSLFIFLFCKYNRLVLSKQDGCAIFDANIKYQDLSCSFLTFHPLFDENIRWYSYCTYLHYFYVHYLSWKLEPVLTAFLFFFIVWKFILSFVTNYFLMI